MSGRPQEVLAIIVAGGMSSRMGTDKAQLVWHGQTLLERAAQACNSSGMRVHIVGREKPAEWKDEQAVFLPDESPHCGPMGGVAAGLEHIRAFGAEQDANAERPLYAVVLSCDMPALSAAAVDWLASLARRCRSEQVVGAAAVTPDEQIQPLFAVYSTTLLPRMRDRLAAGRRSLQRLILDEKLLQSNLPAALAVDIVGVNTPEEFERATRDAESRLLSIPRGIKPQNRSDQALEPISRPSNPQPETGAANTQGTQDRRR